MKHCYQLVVVGAGPAGLAAATLAAEHGMEVAVFDEQPTAGGQVYRDVSASKLADPEAILGKDYVAGEQLVQHFMASSAHYFPSSTVWSIDGDRTLGVVRGDASHRVRAETLILCPGSQERPMPFPGWQLPGVMNAGAAQIMLKSAAMLPTSPPVLAGSGPLLLLLAWQYLNAGIRIKAIVDTTSPSRYFAASRYLPAALPGRDLLFKGFGFINAIRRANIPVYRNATRLRATGENALERLTFEFAGKSCTLDTDTLFIHQGVIPQLQLAKVAGCDVVFSQAQQCWTGVTDRFGASSVSGIYLAGDGQEIAGAGAARVAGQLAALTVLLQSGEIGQKAFDESANPLLKEYRRQQNVRRFLDALYKPRDEFLTPPDDTMICRCEEVDATTIRAIARQGCQGPNQAKSFSRCGMGHCQGRFCEPTVAALIAAEQNRSLEEVGSYRVRPPVKPLTLGQLGRSMQDESIAATQIKTKK